MRASVPLLALSLGILAASPPAGAQGGSTPVRPVEVPEADRQAVLDGNLAFALDLYGRIRQTPGNRVVSPLGVSAVLAMVASGARGETRDQLAAALRLDLLAERFDPAFQSVLAALRPSRGTRVRLDVADALWITPRVRFQPGFVGALREHYGAPARRLDFAADPERAARIVNRWGAKATRGLVPEVLQPGDIDDLTWFVVANAVRFEGRWASRFAENLTTPREFRLTGGGTATVPFMQQEGSFRVSSAAGLQVVELPYRGDEFAFTILVPDAPDGLPALEASLTPEALVTWTSGLHADDVVLCLPRFDLEDDHDLIAPLLALGAVDLFERDVADLSGIAGAPGEMHLKVLRQKARIRVFEGGTVAAAVTAAVGGPASSPPWVLVDRPFLFLLRHRPTGTILFMGRVEDPSPE